MNNSQYPAFNSSQRLHHHPRFGPLSDTAKFLLFSFLHVILALLMRRFNILSTLHAVLIFLIGFIKALTAKDIKAVIPITAYIMGAEVLWRMTNASVFWEFGKYATIAIFSIIMLRKRKIKNAFFPLLFFILLVPSIILTLNTLGATNRAQQLISFNLSGPLAATVCILYFRQIKLNTDEMRNWIWSAVYPIISIFSIAAYSTMTATEIYFGSESVFITSGGYGPNQVSAVLGLGAYLLVILAITGEKKARFWSILVSLAFLTQSFLTFSRGGIYNFTIGLAITVLQLLRKPGRFMRGAFVVLIIGLITITLIIPQLESFTGGTLSKRFTDLNVASREDLARADLQLFLDNPAFGVGPGMALYFRQGAKVSAAHTEYTRLLAEHGIGGVLSFLILLVLLVRSYFNAPDVISKAWVVALAAWPLVEMTHSAMRIVAISFMLGIAMVGWDINPESNSQTFDQKAPTSILRMK